MSKQTAAALEQTLVDILLTEPFFGHLAARLLRVVTDEVNRTGLLVQAGGTIQLGVNPQYWTQLGSDSELRYGAVKHELLHLALLHPFRSDEFPDRSLFHIAADLVVNQYLTPEQLPPDGIDLRQLAALAWKEQQGVAYYYQQLSELLAANKRSVAAEQQQLQQWMQPDHPAQQQHRHWQDLVEEMSPAERSALADNWQHRLKEIVKREHTRSFHQLDQGLRELIHQQLASLQSVRDWRRVLRMFAANSRRMILKDTIRRPSRRYGTVPGVKIRRRQRLLVALDTSGSIPAGQLADFFLEIYQLWRTGAELTLVECDDQIRARYPYRGQAVTEINGRGETAFDEPIKLANELRVDGLIYLTDGFGPVPEVLPRIPILWVISRDGINDRGRIWQELPGRKTRIF